jgi:hypothetical protein
MIDQQLHTRLVNKEIILNTYKYYIFDAKSHNNQMVKDAIIKKGNKLKCWTIYKS